MESFKKILALCISVLLTSSTLVIKAQNLKTWEVCELTLKSSLVFQNPYTEGIKPGEKALVTAIFTGTGGPCSGTKMTIPGFWDGAEIWKIRFAPPLEGAWNYETVSADRKMNGKEVRIIVEGWTDEEESANPVRHGLITVNSSDIREGRCFTYSDGTPFLWIADTWWDWTNRNIQFNTFKKLADTRAEQGYSIGQLFFAGNGWGSESSLLDPSFQNPKLEQIRKVEKMIEYANSKGITVWIHPWWSRDGINKSIGEENIMRWWLGET